MATQFSRANIEHLRMSRVTRFNNRIFSSLGFMNRASLASRIRSMSSTNPEAATLLAEQGILKLSHQDVDLATIQPEHISNIVTPQRWNEVHETLGLLPPVDTSHISVAERVVHKTGDSLQVAKEKLNSAAQTIDRGLDKVTEILNPELRRIQDVYQHGIRTAEDIEILSKIGFSGQEGYSTLSMMGSLALGVSAGIGIAALVNVTLPIGIGIGLTGAFAYCHSPALRDRVHSILKGAVPLGVAALSVYAGREYLDLENNQAFSLLTGFAGFFSTYLVQGIINHCRQKIRIGKLLVEHSHKIDQRDYIFETLENLYKVRDNADNKTRALKNLAVVEKSLNKNKTLSAPGREADKQEVLALIDGAKEAIRSDQQNQILTAIEATGQAFDAIELPDLHVPNQALITFARVSKALNLLFFLSIHPCFFTKAHGPYEALIFGGVYLATAFFTYGCFSYMGQVEQTEKVEVLRYPKAAENKRHRPTLMMFRYTAPGGFDNENPLECLVQDIFARVVYGPAKVIFRNAAAWTCKGQCFGFIKMAHIFEGRMEALKDIIGRVLGNSVDEETRDHMAFSLSIEERAWLAHRTLDDVAMDVYQNAPSEGQVVRFRDSVGRWHGEKATYRALSLLFGDRLEVIADKDLRKKYGKVLRGLKTSVIERRDITLDNYHSDEAMFQAVKRMDEKGLLSDAEITRLVAEVVRPHCDEYLTCALREFADNAGIDAKRADRIATKAARKLASERRSDPIAQLGRKLILLRGRTSQADRTELRDLLVKEYGISEAQAEQLIDRIIATPVQEQAKEMNRVYTEDVDIYYETRDQYALARAREAGEDGNVSKAAIHVMVENEANLSEGQKDFRKAILELGDWALAKKGGPPPVKETQKALKAYSKKIGVAPKDFTDLQWAQFVDYQVSVVKGRSTAILLAKIIAYDAYVHRYEGLGGNASKPERAKIARDLAEEICVPIAQTQLFGKDWAVRVKDVMEADPELTFEGAQLLVWAEWKEGLRPEVEEICRNKGLSETEVVAVWELTATELDRNRREVDVGTMGMLQIMTRETDGVRRVSDEIVAAYTNPASVPRQCLDSAAQLKGRATQLVADLQQVAGVDQKKAGAIHKEIKGLIGKGIGNKRKPGTRGWVKSFREMIDTIPQILINGGGLMVEAEGDSFEMKATNVKKFAKDLDERSLDVLTELTRIETELYEEGLRLRGWIQSVEETNPAPGEGDRLVDRDSLTPFGNAVIGLAKEGLTVDELRGGLAKVPPGVVKGNLSPLNWMATNQGRLTGLLKKIQEGTENRTLRRRENLTGTRLDVTHYFSQKIAQLDSTAAKAGLTNVALLGGTIGDQIGVFLRYCVKKFFEEKSGQTRIPLVIHNWVRTDVTELIRLDAIDENADYQAKLAKGITPDDIARKLVQYISSGDSYKAAAHKVWTKDIALTPEEKARTEAYCEGSAGKIYANLVDVAREIGILTCAPEILGVTSALIEIEREAQDPDYEIQDRAHPYMQSLQQHAGNKTVAELVASPPKLEDVLGSLCESMGRRLDWTQRRQVKHMGRDLYRKLAGDTRTRQQVAELKAKREELTAKLAAAADPERVGMERELRSLDAELITLEESVLYKGSWYTVPAIWTPRDNVNEAKEFIGLDTMRQELIFDRPRTLEEIVVWSASQQGMEEYGLEEGVEVEFGKAARKLARLGDNLGFGRAPRVVAQIADFTADDKLELKDIREDFVTTLCAAAQAKEERSENGIINYLDEGRFERTFFEKVDADFHGNWDLDNITSARFPFFTSHFGYHHGILVNRGDAMLQFGNNYEYQGFGTLIRAQQDKDTTLRDNMWRSRGAKVPRGIVRHRYKRLRKTAFPIGYANIMALDAVMECVKTIEAVNFEDRAKGTYEELFFGSWFENQRFKNIYGQVKRASFFIPLAGMAFAAGMGLFTDDVPGLTSIWQAAGIGAAGICSAKLLKTNPISTTAAAYLGITSFANAFGFDSTLFAGSDFWQIPGWAGVANMSLDLLPRWGSKLQGKTFQMNQYIKTRIMYNILRIVEDSATGVAMSTKGFMFASSKGAVQWNDAVIDFFVLLGQWDRWFGGNAEYLREFAGDFYKYRQSLTMSQWSDLLSCYTYPLVSLALDVNRYALMAVTALWITAFTFTNEEISANPILSHMGWVALLGLLAWKTSMTAFKMSRHHEGAQKADIWEMARGIFKRDSEQFAHGLGAVGRHMLIENYAQPAIREGVMMKFVSDDRIGFKVTINPIRPQEWPKATMRLLKKNWGWFAMFGYLGYKVATNKMYLDVAKFRDFSSAPMAIVFFWLAYEWQKLLLAPIVLKYGNVSDDWHREWEGEKGKHVLELYQGKRESL